MCTPDHPCTLATNCQGLLKQGSRNFTRRRGINGGVNATIHVAILPSVVECQLTECNTPWRASIVASR